MAHAAIGAAATAAIRANTQTQIGLSIPVFTGVKPYTITPEQWIQKVEHAKLAGGWDADQTIGFIAGAFGDLELNWYKSLETREVNPKNWDEVKAELLADFGIQITSTNACKGITKLHQGNRSVSEYYSELADVVTMLVKLTPKNYAADIEIPAATITDTAANVAAGNHPQLDHFNGINDANKAAIRQAWGEKSCISTAHFIMVQIFIEGLKPEIRNEMIKEEWVSLKAA